jgi:hypothetical protein
MNRFEAIKARVVADQATMRVGLVSVIADTMLRRQEMMVELRRAVGLLDLSQNPTETEFYSVLEPIASLTNAVSFQDAFVRLGYDGSAGQAWLNYEPGKSPAVAGRTILELIFEQVAVAFCGGDLVWLVQSLTENAGELVALAQAKNQPVSAQSQINLLTPLREIVGFPQRIQHAFLFKDFRLGDILLKTENEILREPNIGRKSLNELKTLMETHGYKLREWGDRGKVLPPELIEFEEWRRDQPEK